MNLNHIHIHPWNTFSGITEFQRQIQRLFDQGLSADRNPRFPLVNTSANASELIITAEIPGVDPQDLEITLTKGQLTLRGSIKEAAPEGEQVVCHRKERVSGSFIRRFTLPYPVEEDKIAAKYEKGVLIIHLPRAERAQPKTIPVTAS